ncbi:MAG TPA: sigma factor-like helix-turn-helix DNA-binding protein [Chloroflexota bacterium]|nr:sigma factor-like helix-turn-helix DNA-binding protein [Chloroflexota bacterium]
MAHSGWIPPDQLPRLGDWDGPIYGELGVLAADPDGRRVVCHACGRAFGNLGNHVRRTHSLLPAEYRAIFGLRATTGLAGPSYKQHSAELAVRNFSPYWSESASRGMSHEQRVAYAVGRRLRLEAKLDPNNQRVWAENGIRLQQRLRELQAAGLWHRPRPRDPAGSIAKAVARWRELLQDPAYKQRWAEKLSEARGRKQLVCRACGATFTRSRDWKGRFACGPDCARQLRRQGVRKIQVSAPEMRGRISQGRRRSANRTYDDILGRLGALPPQAWEAMPAEQADWIRRYYGLVDGRPASRKQLAAESGSSEWQVRAALEHGVARLLDIRPAPRLVGCPTCGHTFAKDGKRRYCSHRCAVRAARRHPGTCGTCGKPFLGAKDQRFCSIQCSGQERGDTWRARVRSAARRRGRPHLEAPQRLDRRRFARLPALERAAVRAYYGLAGGPPRTHKEIGQALHISQDRVGPLVERAVTLLLASRSAAAPAAATP